MTDLDDLTALQQIDREGMLAHVATLARQCRDGWALTQELDLPASHKSPTQVVIGGMGGSAIGGDLAAAAVSDQSLVPILTLRDYILPAYVDAQTLFIASSYSGNTEETLTAFEAASERGCPLVAVTTGGKLAQLASEWHVPLVSFDYRSQPRAALGYSLASLLGVLRAIGIVGDLDADMEEALTILGTEGQKLTPNVPTARNPAKQLALQLENKLTIVVGAGCLEPVARRWKTQFNENGKRWAYFEALPEMNHNALAGIHFPPGLAERLSMVLLHNGGLYPRTQLRFDLTREILESQGVICHQVPIPGESALAQILSAVQVGDYVSCYLALLDEADPTDIQDIEGLKKRMSRG
jgi:glucose/mannose-6-phosphate isomerase